MVVTAKKLLFLFIQCLIAGLILYSNQSVAKDLLSQIKQRGYIVIGVKSDYPPWGMLDEQHQHAGFEPDLAKKIGKVLEVDVKMKSVTSANRFQKLNEGQVDALIATVGDTNSRRRLVKMVEPHYFRSGATVIANRQYAIRRWTDLIDQPVCLTAGTYFNKTLIQSYRIRPVILMSNRDAKLALMTNKCRAWAYDSGILFHLSKQHGWQDFHLPLPTIIPINWSFVTRSDSDSASLSSWLSVFLAKQIASGGLEAMARQWGLPEIDFLRQQRQVWTRLDQYGQPVCDISSHVQAQIHGCFLQPLTLSETKQTSWWPFDSFDTKGLLDALIFTALFTFVSMAATLGFALSLTYLTLKTPPWFGRVVAFMTQLQSTIPPILMLYLIYFGALSYWNHYGQHWLASGTMIAGLVLSLYTAAGINNLVTSARDRKTPVRLLYQRYRVGVEANLINLAKAAGMASAIASPNAVLAINSLVAASGYPLLLMTLLALFYYGEVMLCAYVTGRLLLLWSDAQPEKKSTGAEPSLLIPQQDLHEVNK